MLFLGTNALRIGRRMFKHQDVVVGRLQQRALQVIRFGERDASEVATAQHLTFSFDVETGEQLTDSFEITHRGNGLTDSVIERESQHKSTPDSYSRATVFVEDHRNLSHGANREHGDLRLDDDRLGPERVYARRPQNGEGSTHEVVGRQMTGEDALPKFTDA